MISSELLAWIESVPFTFASTMPDNPHFYVVQRQQGGPEFDGFVEHIKHHGRVGYYQGHRYRYVEIDDQTHWLTWAGGAGRCINRKPTAEANWDDDEQLRLAR